MEELYGISPPHGHTSSLFYQDRRAGVKSGATGHFWGSLILIFPHLESISLGFAAVTVFR